MASLLVRDNPNITRDTLRPLADHLKALLLSVLGFQYNFKNCWPIKCHGWSYYFVCNLSESTKDRHKARNDPSFQRKRFTHPKKQYPCAGSLTISIIPTS